MKFKMMPDERKLFNRWMINDQMWPNKDTVNVAKNSTVEVDFGANNKGPSLVHCHMQQHMDFGFKALVKYS